VISRRTSKGIWGVGAYKEKWPFRIPMLEYDLVFFLFFVFCLIIIIIINR